MPFMLTAVLLECASASLLLFRVMMSTISTVMMATQTTAEQTNDLQVIRHLRLLISNMTTVFVDS